jgi:hypothetical protein
VTAATDHEQIRAGRDAQQHLRRMSVYGQAPHRLAVGGFDFLADHRFNRF